MVYEQQLLVRNGKANNLELHNDSEAVQDNLAWLSQELQDPRERARQAKLGKHRLDYAPWDGAKSASPEISEYFEPARYSTLRAQWRGVYLDLARLGAYLLKADNALTDDALARFCRDAGGDLRVLHASAKSS